MGETVQTPAESGCSTFCERLYRLFFSFHGRLYRLLFSKEHLSSGRDCTDSSFRKRMREKRETVQTTLFERDCRD
jgi:hypothetical protein